MHSTENATRPGSSNLTSSMRAALMILNEAEKRGLAMPDTIRVAKREIDLLWFTSVTPLMDWLAWAGSTSAPQYSETDVASHHNATVTIYDQQINLVAVVPLTCRRCNHGKSEHAEVGCTAYKGHGQGCRCPMYQPKIVPATAVPA